MRKHLSLIGVLLVLVAFYLEPKAEAQEPYVSPALLLGIIFDSSGDDGLEFYPSLSIQVSAGVYDEEYILVSITGGLWCKNTIKRVFWYSFTIIKLSGQTIC